MAGPRLQPPSSALHLYRHLLREAGYLPPVCRPYITGRIQDRFRRHRSESDPSHHIQRAKHDLRHLRAANAGDMPRMRRLLLLCFGRIGHRRRELVSQFVQVEPPTDSHELAKHIDRLEKMRTQSGGTRRQSDFLDRWDLPKLLQLVKSQAGVNLSDSPRPVIRTKRKLDPAAHVPAENVWGRPLHPKVARTKLRKGWVEMINRVLPPVSKAEWELLQALSTGQAGPELWAVPARRPLAGGPDVTHGSEPWDWQKSVQAAVRHEERKRSRRFKLLSGETDDSLYGKGEPLEIHRYTPRFWKRMYAKIWGLTATVEKRQDNKKDLWDIKWGGAAMTLSNCSPGQREFFEPLDTASATDPASSRGQPSTKRTQSSP